MQAGVRAVHSGFVMFVLYYLRAKDRQKAFPMLPVGLEEVY